MLKNEPMPAVTELSALRRRRGNAGAGSMENAGLTRLRRSVLHLGNLLGWSQDEILVFAEAVTGAPWERCASEDLLAVVGEYRDIMQVLAVRLARRRTRRLADGRTDDAGGDDEQSD
jgi:hypothetical protein